MTDSTVFLKKTVESARTPKNITVLEKNYETDNPFYYSKSRIAIV